MVKRSHFLIAFVALVVLVNLYIFSPFRPFSSSNEDELAKISPIIVSRDPPPSPPRQSDPHQQQQQHKQQEKEHEQQPNQDLEAIQSDLSSCQLVHKLKFVLIDTKDTHDKVRLLIGSIHQHYKKNVKIYVYGLNLNDVIQDEILLWEHVTYFDLEKEFVTSSKADQSSGHLDEKWWRSIVIYDALERAGKVLFLSSDLKLDGELPGEVIETVEKKGAYFASANSEVVIDYRSSGASLDNTEHFLNSHINADLQGYSLNSDAYKHFLLPHIECARRQCVNKELFMLNKDWRVSSMSNEEKEAMQIRALPSNIRPMDANKDKNAQCYIINREDFIHTYKQLPGTPNKSWEVSVTTNQARSTELKDKTLIALGFPSTSKGNRQPSIHNLPLTKVFIPTLLPTLNPDKDRFHYIMYMGFDEGDSFYDVPENREALRNHVKSMTAGYPIEFRMIRVVNSNGWVPFIWNALFQHSMDDGCEYFYQLNDDIKFITPGWATAFVSTLKSSKLGENVGVTGPLDQGNRNILTQAFVHRRHNDIFGFLYPYVFRNWYSDDWITRVYEDIGGLLRRHDYAVHNVQSFGTRYHVCDHNAMLASSLALGRERIKNWRETYVQ